MAAIMLQTIPSFYAKFSENILFSSAKTYEKYFVCKNTTASPITTIRPVLYPLVNITLYYLEKLRNCYINWIQFFFIYQHVDCLYTLFNYRFSGKDIAKSGNVFDKVQRAIFLTKETEDWTKCRVLQKGGS